MMKRCHWGSSDLVDSVIFSLFGRDTRCMGQGCPFTKEKVPVYSSWSSSNSVATSMVSFS